MSVCTVGSDTGPTSVPPARRRFMLRMSSGCRRWETHSLRPIGCRNPQFHDFLLDQDLQTPALKKPQQEEASLIEEDELDKPIKLWEGSFTLGLDGAEGNNQAMNLHAGFNAKRRTELHLLYLDLDYNRRTTNTINTANWLYSQARYERLIPETPWSLFVEASANTMNSKTLIFASPPMPAWVIGGLEPDRPRLRRVSAAVFRTKSAARRTNYYTPEMIVGVDYERRVSYRQKLVATVDYMPNETDFTEFRLYSLAGWEFLLDQETNLSLRLAVRNRYNSSPGTALPNDLDYAALLLWKF